jgi:hypothetical protein
MSRLHSFFIASVAITAAAYVGSGANADTIIGNWESATAEGWIDWSSGQTPLPGTRFAFNSTGATLGSTAVQFGYPGAGYTQWAALKLQQAANGVDEWRDDFLNSAKLALDITLVRSEQATAPSNDFANIGVNINAQGFGFTNIGNPESITPFVGQGSGNSFNPQLLVGTQTSTWTWNIQTTHDGAGTDITQPNPTHIEIIFDTFSNGPVVYHIDNVRLIPVPEPATVGLTATSLGLLGISRRRRSR